MNDKANNTFLYVNDCLQVIGVVNNCKELSGFTERHKFGLDGYVSNIPVSDLSQQKKVPPGHSGIVFEMNTGILGNAHIRYLKRSFSIFHKIFIYWPKERVVERLIPEDLLRYRFYWILNKIYLLVPFLSKLLNYPKRYAGLLRIVIKKYVRLVKNVVRMIRKDNQANECFSSESLTETYKLKSDIIIEQELESLLGKVCPADFIIKNDYVDKSLPFPGQGIYLRTDFWAKISSGGSYGHTCYVAKELNKTSRQFLCIMAHDYSLLPLLKVQQLVMPPPGPFGDEETILQGTDQYYKYLKAIFSCAPPDYIYERICLGNFVGAKLSLEMNIPYIVEYNGSEISMRRSFDGQGYEYESVYLKAEEFAFKQASAVSVVSKHIKNDLINRGIEQSKIFVNPNGVDTDKYKPLLSEEKRELRISLGFSDHHVVVGFTGTFGGWHGVDVLAESLSLVCKANRNVRFLLIGDGNYKHLIDEQIKLHDLFDEVVCTGRVDQERGRKLLGACDIFVSPHNAHMVDSKFFGSPTKIFEYMAMGCGIVSSDLEQIGEVLSPGLRVKDDTIDYKITDHRAILCSPGDVNEFVKSVVFLSEHPELNRQLGQNARDAAVSVYSWEKHVDRIWRFLKKGELFSEHEWDGIATTTIIPECLEKIAQEDEFKDAAQNQWNNDPCGSHYAKRHALHTLDWYLEIEEYRYGQYAPWMPELMEFSKHRGKQLLEIGAGIGTDLAQFAKNGALVTDLDLAAGHLALARENFRLRGLDGTFIQHDATCLPFEEHFFDVVYSNGVIHHIPETTQVVDEIYRVLKPGGCAIIMVYAENSLHYWQRLVLAEGLKNGNMLGRYSMGEIMSRTVEISNTDARPLVKVYSRRKLRKMFGNFENVKIFKRQMTPPEHPGILKWVPLNYLEKLMGWNLIIKAYKPA